MKAHIQIIVFSLCLIIGSAAFYNPTCKSTGFSCLDCYTQKFCVFGVHLSNSSCSSGQPANQPGYCDPNTDQCVAKPPTGCDTLNDSICLNPNGRLPNIKNCSEFFNCKSGLANKSECHSGYVYNHLLRKCILKLQTSDCRVEVCGVFDSLREYENNSDLYISCQLGVAKLKACPNGQIFNNTEKKCVNLCTTLGTYPNNLNCSEFINCTESNNVYTPKVVTCPSGYGYNRFTRKCEAGLQSLCYEIALVQNDVKTKLISLPNFIVQFVEFVNDYLMRTQLDLVTLLRRIGFTDSILSNLLLIIDYVLTYRNFPSAILEYVLNLLLVLLPEGIRGTVRVLLNLVFGYSSFVFNRNAN